MEKRDYSQSTADLIDKLCVLVERKSFHLDKAKATEAILKTYDLFDLPRPKQVVWHKDIFEDTFERSARSARSAGSAWSAGSAGSAWSARSAGSAGSAGFTALDDDFYWFVFEYEYCQNPDRGLAPNENDQKYLEYSQLLLEAMEVGAGYRVEDNDVLHIVPTPLVLIDDQNRFHSEVAPAIRWKGGREFYYLQGESFDKGLWKKIIDQKITASEVMQIDNSDKRTIAISMLRPDEMLKQLNAEMIDTGVKGTGLYKIPNFMDTGETEYAIRMETRYKLDGGEFGAPKEFIEFVRPEVGVKGDAELCQAVAFDITKEQWLATEQES